MSDNEQKRKAADEMLLRGPKPVRDALKHYIGMNADRMTHEAIAAFDKDHETWTWEEATIVYGYALHVLEVASGPRSRKMVDDLAAAARARTGMSEQDALIRGIEIVSNVATAATDAIYHSMKRMFAIRGEPEHGRWREIMHTYAVSEQTGRAVKTEHSG